MSIARNVAANYLGRAYSIASIYLFTPFYIKLLGLAAYGVVSFYGILLAIGTLIDAGLSATLSREAARARDRHELLNLTATIERILLAGTSTFALLACLFAENIARHWLNSSGGLTVDQLTWAVRMMALTIPAQMGISLCVGGMLGLQKQGLGNAIQAAYVTVRGGLVIPALAFHPSLELFLGWQLAASWLMLAIARFAFLRSLGFGGFVWGRASLATLRPTRRFAAGMFALTALAGINTQLDKAIVSKLFSLEQFGIYSLASVLAQLPYTMVAPLTMAMLPRLTQMIHDGRESEASLVYDRFALLIALLAGIGAFGLAFFAPEILSLWLGRPTAPPDAVELVRMFAIGSLFLALAAPSFYLGLAHGHSRTSVVTGAVSAILFVPVMLLAVDRLGLIGAALPWVLVNLASLIALQWNIHRKFHRGGSRASVVALLLVALTCAVLACARWTSTALELGPLAACLMAAGYLVAAVGILLFAVRRELRKWHDESSIAPGGTIG